MGWNLRGVALPVTVVSNKRLAYHGALIATSIRHELVTRFARSRIGGAWMIIHPLSMVLIYALILSAVLSAKLPGIESQYAYAIYLTAGMLGWSLFSEILNRCLGVFIENANLKARISQNCVAGDRYRFMLDQ